MNEPELAVFSVEGVAVTGLAACVPDQVIDNAVAARPLLGDKTEGFVATTGIRYRRVVTPEKTTATDLCCRAAEALLPRGSAAAAAVRAVIFVTQSPDHPIPPNAPLAVQRLGIRPDALSFDLTQSCAGCPYGLGVAALLARALQGTVLVLNGDIMSDPTSLHDPDSFLFGDAGTATLVEPAPATAAPWWFGFRSEPYGRESLYVPAGGTRRRATPDAWEFVQTASGVKRRAVDAAMDGRAVFEYVMKAVPKYVKAFFAASGLSPEAVDLISFHQANLYLARQAIKRSGLDVGKAVFSVEEYGNTGQTSVILNLVHGAAGRLRAGKAQALLAGYGSGLATSLARLEIGPCACPEVVVYEHA